MKKTSTFLGLLAITTIGFAQSPRMSLYEEFTGENCAPCSGTNPVLDPILAANSNNTIPLKWQVAIPSAPSSLTSLYQQNKTEIDARDAYYSISSAPSGRMDGQSQAVFGASGTNADHPANITATILNNAAAVTSPFTVTMDREWDATFSTITCTVNITASANYTTTSTNLKFRLVMTEKEVIYATAPGTNGEKEFHYVARKSFPSLVNGTAMSNTWTTGQTQSFTVACVLPSYIWDKGQVEMVGFIQDDANKKVLQAVLGAKVGLTDDAAAASVSGLTAVSCTTTLVPQVTVKNNGTNTLTNMTLNAYVNGAANGAPYAWTGTLASGATTNITMNPITGLSSGSNTFSVSITNVNNANDYNLLNNAQIQKFATIGTYNPAPIVQGFTTTTFPPTNWILVNPDGGSATWARSTSAGGFGLTTNSTRYNSYNAPAGDMDDLFLPAMSLAGISTPKMSFDMAYTGYTASTPENDQLELKVSTDCGSTWTTLYTKAGANLGTAPATTSNFVPTASQWRTEVVDLVNYLNASELLVKFVATSDYGNNIYVDNINLSGSVGIFDADKNISSIELFPNPTSASTSLKINAANSSKATISVLNAMGQIVLQINESLITGFNTINLDTKQLSSGIYDVVISSNNGVTTKKLAVTK